MSEDTNKLIEERIEEIYNSTMEKPLRVLEIFNDFFGEEKVDMQGYMNLEEFKSWITHTPIGNYINKDMVDMSLDEWNECYNKPINTLSTSQAAKVFPALSFPRVTRKIARVEFKYIFILVHFPHVRVTNENDRFVDINHLWAKLNVCYDGTLSGGFSLNRSEYTLLHLSSNYLHSHISSIPVNDFTIFQTPCLGQGPIRNTITTLNNNYDEDMWKLFCLELSKYVTVESVEGIPHHYLEKLGINNARSVIDRFTLHESYYLYYRFTKLKEFVRHFINTKKLKFNYVNGSYSIGMSLPEYLILISNEFISWYNTLPITEDTLTFTKLIKEGILEECIIKDGKLYHSTNQYDAPDYLSYIGNKVCTFKGKEITIDITDINSEKDENKNKSILFNVITALYILQITLKVLNYKYGKRTDTIDNAHFATEVRYL